MANNTSQWGVLRVVTGFTVGSHSSLLYSPKIYTTLLQGKMLLLARRNRNAAGRRKKAILIGINYNHAQDLQLKYPQRDMRKMYALLKGEVISQWFGRFRR